MYNIFACATWLVLFCMTNYIFQYLSFSSVAQTIKTFLFSIFFKTGSQVCDSLLYMHGVHAAFIDQCRSMMCICSDISCGSYVPCYALYLQHQLQTLLLLTAASHFNAAAAAAVCCITFSRQLLQCYKGIGLGQQQAYTRMTFAQLKALPRASYHIFQLLSCIR